MNDECDYSERRNVNRSLQILIDFKRNYSNKNSIFMPPLRSYDSFDFHSLIVTAGCHGLVYIVT